MTTEELQEEIRNIQHCGQGGTISVIPVLKLMNDKMKELEEKIEELQKHEHWHETRNRT